MSGTTEDPLDEVRAVRARQIAMAREQAARENVLDDVRTERVRQDNRWGEQNWPDGTGEFASDDRSAVLAKQKCEQRRAAGKMTWRDVMHEEIAEAFATVVPLDLRAELVQVAAVAVAWVEAIDRRFGLG